MQRSDGHIVTSHTGALFLPPRDDHGPVVAPTDRDAVRDAVASIVAKQVEIGIDVVNNGDLTVGPGLELHKAFDGLEAVPMNDRYGPARGIPDVDMETFAEYYEAYGLMPNPENPLGGGGPERTEAEACRGPIAPRSTEPIEWDAATLKQAAASQDVHDLFLTFVGPGWMSRWIYDEHYATEQGLIDALAEAARPFYRAIVDAGLILQIDAPDIVDAWTWDRWTDLTAYRKDVEMRLDALRGAIEGLPEERVRLHLCWGSWHGPHTGALPLSEVIDLVYTVPAQCYSIEAAKPNHTHEWRVFAEHPLPDGRTIMPGVIDHTTAIVEHPRVIADRLVAYADVVGAENVIAGTDCGMRRDSRVEWAKLQAMVDGARLASAELFA
jgi:5-methyltetrahydropteroyltriglutamate--homocysteine methyltransferase